jgi:hypothetical protein
MGLGKTLLYFGLRAGLAALTGGASEAGFIAGDALGAAWAVHDVVDTLDTVISSGEDFKNAVESALQDGKLTRRAPLGSGSAVSVLGWRAT